MSQRNLKLVYLWGPALVWMLVIFYFSSRQKVSVSSEYVLNFLFFKLLHILEYAMLYTLYFRATGKKIFVSFFLVILYATSDEIHQMFVPTREGKLRDVIIDMMGAAFSWIFLTKLLPKAHRKHTSWARILDLI